MKNVANIAFFYSHSSSSNTPCLLMMHYMFYKLGLIFKYQEVTRSTAFFSVLSLEMPRHNPGRNGWSLSVFREADPAETWSRTIVHCRWMDLEITLL